LSAQLRKGLTLAVAFSFASSIHEFATRIGKENYLLVGEITGDGVYETVESTGLDAALGIGGMQQLLWELPRGAINPVDYFNLFRNAEYLRKGSHSWLRKYENPSI
jgi:hypothetical protein